MPTLVRCPSCDVHIRADEAACPFCTTPTPSRVIAAIRLVSILAIAGCAYGLPPSHDAGHPDSHVVSDAGVDGMPVDAH